MPCSDTEGESLLLDVGKDISENATCRQKIRYDIIISFYFKSVKKEIHISKCIQKNICHIHTFFQALPFCIILHTTCQLTFPLPLK